jgi:hypothetical protein
MNKTGITMMHNTMNTRRTCRYPISGSLCLLVTMIIGLSAAVAYGGPYADSAHGDTSAGVNRSDIATAGYSRGNCAHCHEQHASIEGDEPTPAGDSPSAFLLFTDNFDTTATGYPYSESDDICFSCHNDAGSIMQVTNNNYIQTFAGYTPATPINSILDAFTPYSGYPHSEHNLYDVWNYARTNFSFFTASSNPCTACHNPHLAKRNKTDPDNPALTAISRPTDHGNLWGDDASERMDNYSVYQPPYMYGSTSSYEPDGSALHDGSKMPDYNTFCLDCHSNSDVYSTKLGRNMTAIDWSSSGDMHGGKPRTNDAAQASLRAPYSEATANYVLSCVDCHEPHGTVLANSASEGTSSFLLRKEMNGEEVLRSGGASPFGEFSWFHTDICIRCHSFAHCGPANGDGCLTCHYHGSNESGCGFTGPTF